MSELGFDEAVSTSATGDIWLFRGRSIADRAIQTLGRATTVRNDVQAQLDQLKVRVNPRFESAVIAIYSEPGPDNKPLSLVSVPLADTDPAPVIDAA